ncbi:gamma-glutamyltranspeptidase [Gonapodya prolifera JEL478]|uniref:Glutathione hydrolase n=1 Tax=Gonapodya prolifera (strain JEL478) TaxID=1344416 RepID=A0A139AM56_GONPJ|nr:gamma-glutamyltranspeptidase [Gonapodya prolifera JEL478]|eukprot:KXS17545.1 gamma-glutamyltranspeptidase [Gonapodya prolifera JEL478]
MADGLDYESDARKGGEAHFTGDDGTPSGSQRMRWCGRFWMAALALASASCLALLTTSLGGATLGVLVHAPVPVPVSVPVSHKGVVTGENMVCSELGRDVMRQMGGNAVDAAVAVGMCLGVLHPFFSGVGGGGFMTVRLPNGTAKVINFRERAPKSATLDMYVGDPARSQVGGLAVGVPGEVAGLWEAHKRYGTLPWSTLVEPSAKIADEFVISPQIHRLMLDAKDLVLNDPAFAAVYAPHGTLLAVGDVTSRKNYANTLRRIALEGADAIYNSDMTEHLVSFVNSKGGNMSVSDFRDYFANVEEPLVGWYHGLKVITARPPASGAVLLASLTILEAFNLALDGATPLSMHRMVEAWKFAYAYRSELGDPGADGEYIANLSRVLDRSTDKQWGAGVRQKIFDDQTFPPEYYGSKFSSREMPGTTAYSVLDESDMAVAVTLTVNLIFGARIMDPVTGIVLNNQMDDFSWPNYVNNGSQAGLPASPANYISPGKRPLSASTPTIVERDGRVAAVVAASGGSKITTGVAYVLHHMLDFYRTAEVAAIMPRIHHQLFPNVVSVEEGVSNDWVDGFRSRGHEVRIIPRDRHLSVTEPIAAHYRNYNGRYSRVVEGGRDPRAEDGGVSGY